MKSDVDEVVLQGIEFWSTICDEEMDLAIEAAEVKVIDTQDIYTCLLIKLLCIAVRGMY